MSLKVAIALGFLGLSACGSEYNEQVAPTHVDAQGQKRYMPDEKGHVKTEAAAANKVFRISLTWDVKDAHATLNFTDSAGAPAAHVSDVKVRLMMPAHGHEGAHDPVAKPVYAGMVFWWEVSGLAPSMPGDWLLQVDAVVEGQRGRVSIPLYFPNTGFEHVH